MLKRIVFLSCLILLICASTSLASLTDGLVGYWSFDNCDATDTSGNGNNGTISGNPQCVAGEKANAFSFDGLPDYVEVPHSDLLNPTQAVTISLWAKEFSGSPAYSSLIYKAGEESAGCCKDRVYSLWTRSDQGIHFASTPEGASNHVYCDTPGGQYSLNEFVHVGGVIDTASHTMTIYVNGNKAQVCSNYGDSIRTGSYPLRIGSHFHTGGDQFNFNGIIDEVHVYNRALSEAEIQELYNGSTPPPLVGNLVISKNDAGSGMVTSSDGAIKCGAACSKQYPIGATVTLSALASSNAGFYSWSGGGCSGKGSCTVTIDGDVTVTANFIKLNEPADEISALRLNGTHSVGDGRVPLILVHGTGQTEDFNDNGKLDDYEIIEQSSGWKDFLNYYGDNSILKDMYKIYIFQYLSDIESVHEIGRSLRNHIEDAINRGELEDTGYVILAHSMGGLVSRSFMQEYSFNTGERCGERVSQLITLATPHHGSPGANDMSLTELLKNADKRDKPWQTWWGLTNDWQHTWQRFSGVYWLADWSSISYDEPNRKDLLWDNFDNMMNKRNRDINVWLQTLNRDKTYDSKISLFYGYYDIANAGYKVLVDKVYSRLTVPRGPMALFTIAAAAKAEADEHKQLMCASILMNYGLNKNNVSPYVWNDGMVPLQSGAFNGHTVAGKVRCPDHDHLDMLGVNTNKKCATGKSLLESVRDSLISIAQP